MNLLQYLIDNPTKTYAETILHEESVDTKQVGSGQARGFFIRTNVKDSPQKLWAFFNLLASDPTHEAFDTASGIVVTASDAQSYFGMDDTKADGIANRQGVADLVTADIMDQDTADAFIALTLTITKPFKDVTEPQWDAEKLISTLQGTTSSIASETIYNDATNQPFSLNSGDSSYQVHILLDAPAVTDTTVELTLLHKDAKPANKEGHTHVFSEEVRKIIVPVRQGQQYVASDIIRRKFKRHVQFTGEIQLANTPIKLEVVGA